MGTIYKRENVYYIDYHLNGKRVRKKIGKSKKIAEIALKDIEVKIAKNEIGIVEKDLLIDSLFNEFLKYSQTNHTPSTARRYREVIDHFKTFLQNYPEITKLSHLKPHLFEKYKSYRRNGNSINTESTEIQRRSAKTRTVNFEITALRVIFNMAIKWGYLRENPTKGIPFLKILDAKPPRFLSKKECKLLLENCGENYYPIFYTFLYTGMRKGELLNLEWDDIDFKRRKILIRKKPFWSPKTGEREIPMNQNLAQVLKKFKKKQGSKSNFVFCDANGKQYYRSVLRKVLMKITKECGFPDVTKLHSLRHTFASHLVMKGVDLPTIQKLMGHADIQTTMIYAHLSPDHLVDAVDKLDF